MITLVTRDRGLSAWVLSSRMHQLALEIRTPLRHSQGPMLKLMHMEGWYEGPVLRGTKKNKQLMLAALVELHEQLYPTIPVGIFITKALEKS